LSSRRTVVLPRRQIIDILELSQVTWLAHDCGQFVPTTCEDNYFRSKFQHALPLNSVRRSVIVGQFVSASGNLNHLFDPVSPAVGRVHPLHNEHSRTTL